LLLVLAKMYWACEKKKRGSQRLQIRKFNKNDVYIERRPLRRLRNLTTIVR
jgi:hypothetical protein